MIRLDHPNLDPLVVDDYEAGWSVELLDIGMPQVREVMTARPRSDGVVDETEHVGARAVAMTVRMWNCGAETADQKRTKLAAFCHPRLRPTMTYERDGAAPRVLTLRAGDLQAPLDNPRLVTAQALWLSDGPVFGATDHLTILSPSTGAPGWTPPLDPPWEFPGHTGGPSLLINDGSTPTAWNAVIFGPCVGPKIINRTTGQELSFPGLGVPAGSWLWIDTAAPTINVEQVPAASRYSYFDFVGSSWWSLPPGGSMVEFTAESSASPASAWLQWRDAYIL